MLSIQGEAVSVDLSGGPGLAGVQGREGGAGHTGAAGPAGARVLATAVGPEVPEEGHFPVPAVSPCAFVATFVAASRAIPLSASQFALIDEQGHVHRPKMTALGGGPPPSEIAPGRPVSVKLHDILPTGDGALAWTPQGTRPVVTWDYTVEID